MKLLWKISKGSFLAIVTVMILIIGLNFWVVGATEDQVYYHLNSIPANKVGLILGTSKRTTSGDANKYFQERIASAAALFHQGKVEHIIVSGDNRSKYYNEPRDMYNALVALGVPKNAITLDFAGLRTLDSVVRAKSIFGQRQFTIITQNFHCYRALFIANYFGMNVIAFSADSKDQLPLSLAVREIFARFVAVFDLYVWQKTPAIMGEKEEINLN